MSENDRASALWALVGRLERGEEQQVDETDPHQAAQLLDDLQTAQQLRHIFKVIEALDETGALVKLDAHGDCSCNDGHCPGFDPPRSPTEDELQEMAYKVLVALQGQASDEHDWYRQQRPRGAR